jgi:malonate decarboxylase beta subunit
MTTSSTPDASVTDWQAVIGRTSFLEFDARTRAEKLLDAGTVQVLCGPFTRLESPWLAQQGVTPQADDGVVIARGTVSGQRCVVISIEQGFQGGGIGEVSGAKISQALRLAAADSRAGTVTAAVLLFETGGVRLQEANLGLNAVAEICAAVIELRTVAPVVGVIAGMVGSFGGMSIAAGLCSHLIMTAEGRLGLNGPAVIEQEAGPAEFDASDRALIWAVNGGRHRTATGLADTLVPDDVDALVSAVGAAIAIGPLAADAHRSARLDALSERIASVADRELPESAVLPVVPEASRRSRGRTWLSALSGVEHPDQLTGSVICAESGGTVYLAVVPDPGNRFPRAREGQVGVTEALALARAVTRVVAEDAGSPQPRGIVAVVDLPSQAYGRVEELIGLHQAIAATVDAYAAARAAGHPVVAIVVGTALSGGFLAHGLQASRILALDDPGVEIHAMHKSAAARITLRTEEELDQLALHVLPLSYRVQDWAQLGVCDGLLQVDDAEHPGEHDVDSVRSAVYAAVEAARDGAHDLSHRLDSPAAVIVRTASRQVRTELARQWA